MAKKARKTVSKKAVRKSAKAGTAPKKKVNALRPGGRRFEVYNEGLCVYLHDEGHAETLRKLIAKKGDEGNTFYDNLSLPAFAKVVRADGLAASYELFQDDEIYVEVIVGPPLTKKELAASRWFPPQQVRLNLPTGRMRIDTPNTMPLDPEENEDEGAVVEVPPGDYIMSLYRVDWDACRRESLKHKGTGEVIVLTPRKKGSKPPTDGPILPYPTAVEETDWMGAFKVTDRHCECQVNFWDYWEWIRINLESKAVKKLGLECGSVLQMEAAKMKFKLIYLGDLSREMYFARFGREKLDKLIAGEKEVAIGGWQELGGRKILSFFRDKSSKAVPEKYHETWIPATVDVLAESYPPPAESKLPQARRDGDTIHAAVALSNAELMIVNVTAETLADFGKTFKLVLPHGVHTVALDEQDRQHLSVFFTGKVIPDGFHYLKAMGLRSLVHQGKLPKKVDEYQPLVLPASERRPVTGMFPPASSDPAGKFLHIREMYVDGSRIGFDWPAPPAIGTAVQITK